MDGYIFQHLWQIDDMDCAERTPFWTDAATRTELCIHCRFLAVRINDDAFCAIPVHRTELYAQIVSAPLRVTFLFLNDCYACHRQNPETGI